MKFWEAMKALCEGKKVRLSYWNKSDYIDCNNDFNFVFKKNEYLNDFWEIFEKNDLEKIYRAVSKDDFEKLCCKLSLRNKLILQFVYWLMIPLNKVLHLKVSSLDFKNHTILLEEKKMKIPDFIWTSLLFYIGERKEDLIFVLKKRGSKKTKNVCHANICKIISKKSNGKITASSLSSATPY